MGPGHDASPHTDEDPAAASSDALSLHTIAEQADVYAVQEQEDADFALALSLEEEDTRNLTASQQPQPRSDTQSGAQDEAPRTCRPIATTPTPQKRSNHIATIRTPLLPRTEMMPIQKAVLRRRSDNGCEAAFGY